MKSKSNLIPKKISIKGGGQRTYWVNPNKDRAEMLRNYAQAKTGKAPPSKVPTFEIPKNTEIEGIMRQMSDKSKLHVNAYYSDQRWREENHSPITRRAFLGMQAALDKEGKLLPALSKEQLDRSDSADIPPKQLAIDAAKISVGEWKEFPEGHPFASPTIRKPSSYADEYDKDPNLAEYENAMEEIYGSDWRNKMKKHDNHLWG